MKRIVWIRYSILMAILASLLPFIIDKAWQASEDVATIKANVNRDLSQSTDFAQRQFLQIRSEVESTLKTFALVSSSLVYVTPGLCNTMLSEFQRRQQMIATLSILTPQATVYCSTDADRVGTSRAGATHIEASLRQSTVAWTDLSADPETGELTLRAALTFRRDGDVAFVVEAEIDSQTLLSRVVTSFRIPESTVSLLAQDGAILLLEGPHHAGGALEFSSELKQRLLVLDRGTIDATSLGGERNLLAVDRLPGTSVRLVSELPIAGVFTSADRKLIYGILGILIEAMIISAIVMLVVEYTLLGALRTLVSVAEEISQGNVTARANVKTPFPDLHLLAGAFNVMVDRLEESALQDGLTMLPNRKCLDRHLQDSLRRFQRYGTGFSVAMIDVDQFKLYNDLYGHLAGDDVLRRISATFSAYVRRPDEIAGRFGGEEFLLVLTETDRAKIAAHLDRLRQTVAALAIPHARSTHGVVTVSIGFAVAGPGDTVQTMIERADQSLYAVKSGGRNAVLCQDLGATSV